jgi:hypothetical protein
MNGSLPVCPRLSSHQPLSLTTSASLLASAHPASVFLALIFIFFLASTNIITSRTATSLSFWLLPSSYPLTRATTSPCKLAVSLILPSFINSSRNWVQQCIPHPCACSQSATLHLTAVVGQYPENMITRRL